jgi:hypothetical protein
MKKPALTHGKGMLRRSALLGLAIAGLSAAPALAATTMTDSPPSSIDGTSCAPLTFTQALSPAGDNAWYTMINGESVDQFTGTGWTLGGGAAIKTTTLADGTTGQVLDLPSGATAYSPPVCIDEGFQEARSEVNDVKGSEGIQFYIQPWSGSGWGKAQNTGQIHSSGWNLSGEMNLNNNVSGWELVRFKFQAGGNVSNPSNFEMYNFWLDPRMMR